MAFILGLVAARLRLPLILGYLMAGLIIGPFTPGFVADSGIATQLSEIGVTLLMFGVGLHFSIKDLLAVRKVAIPGALVQIGVATLLGAGLVHFWGYSWGAGIVFGLCLSVASTVVLLRALRERGLLESINGKLAVGWLIVEDLVTIIALVALPALSVPLGGVAAPGHDDSNMYVSLATTLGKVIVFVGLMLVVGKRAIPLLLGKVARTGSRELFTIGVLATALGIAFGASALFNVSPALGAFFAGVVISESDLSHQAGAEMLPLQEAFTVLFFVSVGMMFDPSVLLSSPIHVLLALLIVLVGKSLAALAIVLMFKYPMITALTVAASLAQIGEFSFILIGLGTSLKIVPQEAVSIVLAAAIISISLNPLIFKTIEPVDNFLKRFPRLLSILERKDGEINEMSAIESESLRDHAVMIGYGRVGATIARALQKENIPFVVVDQDRTVIDQLKADGIPAIFGDASRPGILTHAHLADAKLLIIATPAKSHVREILEYARASNPDILACVRTHNQEDAIELEEQGIGRVVMGELELALQMSAFSLSTFDRSDEQVRQLVGDLRQLGSRALEIKRSDR